MAIRSGQQIDRTELSAATDSTVTNPSSGASHEVYSLLVHERGGSSAVVDLYLSSDANSAAAERVDRLSLGANETKSFKPVVVAAGQYLIMQSDVANVNYHGAYTLRNGGDV